MTDRKEFWTLDGDAIRWLGVVLAAGGALRLWPVVVLRKETGSAGWSPSNPGTRWSPAASMASSATPAIWGCSSWALAFRSGVGLLITALIIPVVLARVRGREGCTHSSALNTLLTGPGAAIHFLDQLEVALAALIALERAALIALERPVSNRSIIVPLSKKV